MFVESRVRISEGVSVFVGRNKKGSPAFRMKTKGVRRENRPLNYCRVLHREIVDRSEQAANQ